MADSAAFKDAFYSAPDGLKLHARIYGAAGDGSAAGRLPARTDPQRARLPRAGADSVGDPARPRQVIAFDYRGRGRSAYDPDWKNYTVPVEAGDIVAGLTALGIEHGVFIGTSRGGLIIHVLAAIRPAALKAVILNDIGPVVEGEGLAHIRAYLERAPKPQSICRRGRHPARRARGGVSPRSTTADWERMVDALYRRDDGVPVPDFDPKLLNMLRDFDLNKPLPELWPQFDGLAGDSAAGDSRRQFEAAVGSDARRNGAPSSGLPGGDGRGPGPCAAAGDGRAAADHPGFHQPRRAEDAALKRASDPMAANASDFSDSKLQSAQAQKKPGGCPPGFCYQLFSRSEGELGAEVAAPLLCRRRPSSSKCL